MVLPLKASRILYLKASANIKVEGVKINMKGSGEAKLKGVVDC